MKIGIIRIDRMGDMILTLPIIKALKLYNDSDIIDIFCSNKNYKIVKDFKYIDNIFNHEKLIKKNKKNYDILLNFSPGWKSFFLCLGIKSKLKGNIILSSRYKKKSYSKLLLLLFSKIFFKQTIFINRIDRFNTKKVIHQTDIMFELLNLCKMPYKKILL